MKPFVLSLLLAAAPCALPAQPLYPNSVASNDLDFIRPTDTGACWSLARTGSARTEMYDPRRDTLFVAGALHFDVTFPDRTIRINVHPDVGHPQQRATQAAASVSRLPDPMRTALRAVHILDGDGPAWAEDLGRFFTLYDDLMDRRLAAHDLDETVFHETAHIALDPFVAKDPDWRTSQILDGAFITRYAAEHPDSEDIAESALFAWTLLFHPDRLPNPVKAAVRDLMPNRLDYLGNILEGFDPPSCPSRS